MPSSSPPKKNAGNPATPLDESLAGLSQPARRPAKNLAGSTVEKLPTPLPCVSWSHHAFWGSLALLGLLTITAAWRITRDPNFGTHLEAPQLALLQQLATQTTAVPSLSSAVERAAFEQQLSASYRTIKPISGAELERSTILLTLSELALQRGDSTLGITAARASKAYAEIVARPLAIAQAQLALTEGYLLADHVADLAVPAIQETIQRLATVPPTEVPPTLTLRLAMVRAQAALQLAIVESEQDQRRRQLALVKLKAKSLALSEQLRAELNGEFQKREQLQNEAATTNDPAKMIQASTEKDACDAKFSAALKEREERMKSETVEAMKPNATIGELQEAATNAWRNVLLLAETAGASEKVQARHGLAAARLLQGNAAEAEGLLRQVPLEADADPLLQARTQFLQARCAAEKAAQFKGDPAQAKAAAENGMALTTKTQEILNALPGAPNVMELHIRTQLLAADFETLLGHADAAAAQHQEALASEQSIALDGGWKEVFWNAGQTLAQAQQQFIQSVNLTAGEQWELADAVQKSLKSWHAEVLSGAPDAPASLASAASLVLISSDLDRFPWFPLLEKLAPLQ